MKLIFVFLMILSLSKADEMTRIEAIVDDISQLRSEYEECRSSLENKDAIKTKLKQYNKYKKLYEKEMQKNTILKAELDFKDDLTKSNKILSSRVLELEKQVKTYKKTNKYSKIKCKPCVKSNSFPKLMMKEKHKIDKEIKKQISIKEVSEKIIKFKPSSFKLKVDASIYNAINGKKISKWVKNTSFTSNQKTLSWIKVSGYFVNKKWTSAKKDMWIKKAQVIKK